MRPAHAPGRPATAAATAVRLAVLAALLAAPTVQATWNQPGGDALRSGNAGLGELDVVATMELMPQGVSFDASNAGVLDTGHGLIALGHRGADCVLVTVDPDGRNAKETSRFACPVGAHLAAWSEPYALVCVAGTSFDAILQAWVPGAATAQWSRVPATTVPDAASLPAALGQTANTWNCNSIAVDGGRLYVAFASTTGRNRIEALDAATGDQVWSTAIPSSVFLNGLNASVLPAEVLDATGAFRAEGVTRTATGILVSGRLDGTQVADAPPGAAWLDTDGVLRGAFVTSVGPGTPVTTNQPTLLPTSRWGAAQGNLAAVLIGDGLFTVNPRLAQGSVTTLGNPSLGQNNLAGLCWSRDHILVPGEGAAFILPVNDPSAFVRWPGLPGGRIQACAIQHQTAWLLVSRDEAGPTSDLVLVDLASADSLVRVPVGLRPGDPLALTMGLVPLPDGAVLVYDGAGHGALLRPVAEAPIPTVSTEDEFPAADAPAVVNIELPKDAPNGTRLLLAWGDGRLEEGEPGRYSHTYADAGDMTVRLVAVYPDARTATATKLLHVGASPPPPRSWIDIALAPENQNYTFTALGVSITIFGAVMGAVGVHRGRHRLERHMKALDRLHAAGRRDPFAAIHDLHQFREDRRHDLAKGNLDDGQYTVLEASAERTLQLLRQRILGTFVGRVTDAFTHLLDVALADGALDDDEAQGLLANVGDQGKLNKTEKERLSSMIRAWNKAI